MLFFSIDIQFVKDRNLLLPIGTFFYYDYYSRFINKIYQLYSI